MRFLVKAELDSNRQHSAYESLLLDADGGWDEALEGSTLTRFERFDRLILSDPPPAVDLPRARFSPAWPRVRCSFRRGSGHSLTGSFPFERCSWAWHA